MKPRLLLIAPVFFGYYKEIIREATALGYDVDYICDAPSNTSFTKAITRVCKETVPLLAKRYFNERILTKIAQKHYDYVLLLAAMTFALTPEMVDKIRSMQPEAWFVIYQWDSEHNLPYVKDIHQYFDARITGFYHYSIRGYMSRLRNDRRRNCDMTALILEPPIPRNFMM